MHEFWREFILPMANTININALVEVGSENGKGTEKLARYAVSRGAVLHTIDPRPLYDIDDVKTRFGSSIVIHQALSLEALPSIGRFDMGLIDGDHNWYTVYHELKAIDALHHDCNDADFPLLFFHDVAWPYGRRDMYYDIDTIPEAFRQPARRAGVAPGRNELYPGSGLNPDYLNAEHEGGERNGVHTAIDDFRNEHDDRFDFLFIPIEFGFGALASKARLAKTPALEERFDHWRSESGLHDIIRIGEHFRNIKAVLMQEFHRRAVAQRQED